MTKITNSLRYLITAFEGQSLKRYKDSKGLDTIGIGHLIAPWENIGNEITEEQCEEYFRADIGNVINQTSLPSCPNRFQEEAIYSFVFNLGIGNYNGSTLRKVWLDGDDKKAGNELLKWCHEGKRLSPGLLKRRVTEYFIFKSVTKVQQINFKFILSDKELDLAQETLYSYEKQINKILDNYYAIED